MKRRTLQYDIQTLDYMVVIYKRESREEVFSTDSTYPIIIDSKGSRVVPLTFVERINKLHYLGYKKV